MADSLYDRLGGIDAITAVVGSFRDRVAGDDRIIFGEKQPRKDRMGKSPLCSLRPRAGPRIGILPSWIVAREHREIAESARIVNHLCSSRR